MLTVHEAIEARRAFSHPFRSPFKAQLYTMLTVHEAIEALVLFFRILFDHLSRNNYTLCWLVHEAIEARRAFFASFWVTFQETIVRYAGSA